MLGFSQFFVGSLPYTINHLEATFVTLYNFPLYHQPHVTILHKMILCLFPLMSHVLSLPVSGNLDLLQAV